jgi:hypothetical protein
MFWFWVFLKMTRVWCATDGILITASRKNENIEGEPESVGLYALVRVVAVWLPESVEQKAKNRSRLVNRKEKKTKEIFIPLSLPIVRMTDRFDEAGRPWTIFIRGEKSRHRH